MPQQFDLTDLGASPVDLSDLGATPLTQGDPNRVTPRKPTPSTFDISNLPTALTFGLPIGTAGEVLKGAATGVKNIISAPFQLAAPPQSMTEALLPPGGLFLKRTLEPQLAEYEKSKAATTTPEILGHAAAAAVPMFGPLAAHLGEVAGAGDVGKALGEGLIYAAAPEITKGIGKSVTEFQAARQPKLDMAASNKITRVLQPSNKDFTFEASRDRAIPEIAQQAQLERGDPKAVKSVGDFVDLGKNALERLRAQYEQFVAPFRPAITVDGAPIANAIRKTVTRKMLLDNPSAAQAVLEKANRYDKTLSLAEAEDLLERTNNDLAPYYRKDRMNQATQAEHQTAASDLAIAKNLRRQIYERTDAMAGKGVAEVQQRYGALKDMIRYAEPLSLDIARYGKGGMADIAAEGAADVAAGAIYSKSAAMVKAGRGLARMFRGGPDEMIAAAFKRLGPNVKATTPAPVMKPIRGLLGKGATLVPPPETSFVRGTPAMEATQTGQRLLPPGPNDRVIITPPPGGYSTGFEPPQVGGFSAPTFEPPSVTRGGKGVVSPQTIETQLTQQFQQGHLTSSDLTELMRLNPDIITEQMVNRVIAKSRRGRR